MGLLLTHATGVQYGLGFMKALRIKPKYEQIHIYNIDDD